jgi:hypothetical protein
VEEQEEVLAPMDTHTRPFLAEVVGIATLEVRWIRRFRQGELALAGRIFRRGVAASPPLISQHLTPVSPASLSLKAMVSLTRNRSTHTPLSVSPLLPHRSVSLPVRLSPLDHQAGAITATAVVSRTRLARGRHQRCNNLNRPLLSLYCLNGVSC